MEVLIDNEQVKAEFIRWCKFFGDNDPYTKDGNIGILDVLRAHFLIADYFYTQSLHNGDRFPQAASFR